MTEPGLEIFLMDWTAEVTQKHEIERKPPVCYNEYVLLVGNLCEGKDKQDGPEGHNLGPSAAPAY